ncbi:DUF4105 domain-containing protein [Bacteriovorax sp. DB6_IX]|uniref:Lnb N-terminal periplasmic domain-containing protein n=1 Tax=Bacteriovorax sp. DB6_IX TaxID=1353530 RepID=UPI0018DFB514|nr:DUF4105 domain-containing protein [Bacteriovorax sp. DB6_IX]
MPCLLLAVDEAWLRLLYYEKSGDTYENKASHDFFFVSKEGRRNPHAEIEASLEAIEKELLVGKLKKPFQCAFPARFDYLKKRFKLLNKEEIHCPEFDEWKNEINAQEVFLVYASSYVSNPASMFGHSFLRLSQGGRERSDALLDYSVGFMAITDPRDSSLMYSIKGITGQYLGFFDIKPFYMQVGLYQNAEDRDLWEYRLPLDKFETEYLIKHMWEVSRNTGFPYYFFDENCSYYILRMIEAIKPNWHITTHKKYLFAHPIETLKWMDQSQGVSDVKQFQSINKVLRKRISRMSSKERSDFRKAKTDLATLSKVQSVEVLDALIDFWKHENYDKNTQLSKTEAQLMNKTFALRAQLDQKSSFELKSNEIKDQDPSQFHDPNKLTIQALSRKGRLASSLDIHLGYHGRADNPLGHDDYSYIDYLGLKLSFDKQVQIDRIRLVEINSHAPFVRELPKFSWKIKALYDGERVILKHRNFLFEPGLGLTFFMGRQFVYGFLSLENRIHQEGSHLIPKLNFGMKNIFSSLVLVNDYELRRRHSNLLHSFKSSLFYYLKSKNGIGLRLENLVGDESVFEIGLNYRIYF